MRKTAIYLLLFGITLLLFIAPAAAESPPGVGAGVTTAAPSGAQQVDKKDHNYKPPEHRADDGTMAAVVSAIFGLPVAGWLVTRSLRKAKKNSK